MATMTKKMLKVSALIWASVFCILVVLFVAMPGKEALIKTLWGAQIAVVGFWGLLYCIQGVLFVGECVAGKKKAVHGWADGG